jgi:hypothetical protein
VAAVADGARWALITLLFLAAAEKSGSLLRGTTAWHPVFLASPARRRWARPLMSASLLADMAAVVLLVAFPQLGAVLAFILVVTYTLVARTLHKQDSRECRCFFKYFNSRTRSGLIARNTWILLLTVCVLLVHPTRSSVGVLLGGVLLASTRALTLVVDRFGDRGVRAVGSGEGEEGVTEVVGVR